MQRGFLDHGVNHLHPLRMQEIADALNQESGRLYTRALVEHYRVYRQTAWALRAKAERWRIVRVTRCEPPPGIRRVGSLEEAALLTRGRGAIVPNGPATWVTRTRRPP